MKKNARGVVLISTFITLLTLTALVAGFIWMISAQARAVSADVVLSQAVWLAEAGAQKAVWNLKTPTGSGGQGEDWTTAGTTESLGDGTYTMEVSRYDFSLASNGSTASDSPAQTDPDLAPSMAIDGDDGSTYWESKNRPSAGDPQNLIIAFPYPLTINKVRFLSTASANRPRNYTWAVSSDGSSYTTVVTTVNNSDTDVTDTFSAQSSVSYLRLQTTIVGTGSNKVRVLTLEAIGSKITSTGTVAGLSREVQQTVVADDGSPENQVAYDQIDWTETAP